MNLLTNFLKTFYDYTVDIIPYFLIALVITSLLQSFTKLSWLKAILKKEKVAPIYTGILGGLLPLCSCSMLPVANLINSMSKSYAPVLSFLIIAPVISPVTLLLTYGYFGLSMTLVRLIGTFIFAISFAYLVSFFFTKPKTLPIMMGGDGKSKNSKLFFYILKDNLFGIGKYLFLGIFIASLIKVLVPASLIKPIAGSIFSYLLISFVSVPIYVCSGEEVPIAKALTEVGFTWGNALTFMLGGTGICMPTILAVMKFLPKALVFAYVVF
ncbi:MAG TPA: permease [Aquificaceae bacterium]|nr:permease [Aquificaceae bacterium]